MASPPKACLLLAVLSQAGLFIIVLTVVSRNVAHFALVEVADDVSLPASSWNDSSAWSSGLRYISVKEMDRLLRQGGSAAAGATREVNMRSIDAPDGQAKGQHKYTSSFNCSSAAAAAGYGRLPPWCTIRRYPDTVDVEMLNKSNLLPTEVRDNMHCSAVICS